ncbi:jerky protein homolog-like [Trichonephila clavipes]|nr:jerky protein homolog-like [Trichonephila clavipes]
MLAKLQFVIGEKIVESLNNTVLILLARLLKADRQQSNRFTIKLIMRFIFGLPRKDKEEPPQWAYHSRKGYSIKNKLMNGDASFSASIGWLDRIAEGNYSPQQIYNADETGLNFRALPKKSFASQDEKSAPGYKKSKDRVTLMACSISFGNHKLPLMVIGKSAKPRAFKNVNMKSLLVYYRSQKKAWMNAMLFNERFHDQFVPAVKKFNKENDLPQRAILLIDNAPSHPGTEELSSGEIKAIFYRQMLPLLQPMDQGVLQKLKQICRKQFLRTLIEDDTVSLVAKIKQTNMKDVVC